jgi:hypothetical protein
MRWTVDKVEVAKSACLEKTVFENCEQKNDGCPIYLCPAL